MTDTRATLRTLWAAYVAADRADAIAGVTHSPASDLAYAAYRATAIAAQASS